MIAKWMATAGLVLVLASASASAAPLLIDGAGATNEGDCTFACVIRYQQAYDNALFGAGPINISKISFFASNAGSWAAGNSYSLSIGIAARQVNNLSSTFAQNVGTVSVFQTKSFSGSVTTGQMYGFDGSYLYNPVLGDLIIDIVRVAGNSSSISSRYNYQSGGEFSRVYSFSSLISGSAGNNYGNATQFELGNAVPEPGALGLFGAGLVAAAAARRRRKR